MGAVDKHGNPYRAYCENTARNHQYPWFSKCCKWQYKRCLPKSPADGKYLLDSLA